MVHSKDSSSSCKLNFPLNKLVFFIVFFFFQNLCLVHTLQVWDNSIIETAEEKFYDSNVDELINTLQTNITVLLPLHSLPSISHQVSAIILVIDLGQTVWANQAKAWEGCSKTACPDA